MEYVDQMKKDNLDTLSEFLVMAATLLDIKSKMLLPKKEEEGIGFHSRVNASIYPLFLASKAVSYTHLMGRWVVRTMLSTLVLTTHLPMVCSDCRLLLMVRP